MDGPTQDFSDQEQVPKRIVIRGTIAGVLATVVAAHRSRSEEGPMGLRVEDEAAMSVPEGTRGGRCGG